MVINTGLYIIYIRVFLSQIGVVIYSQRERKLTENSEFFGKCLHKTIVEILHFYVSYIKPHLH